jgi:hypothetical protein
MLKQWIPKLSWLEYLVLHALVSTAVMFGAMLLGPMPIDGSVVAMLLYGYLAIQLISAILVVANTTRGSKLPAAALGVAAVAWAI